MNDFNLIVSSSRFREEEACQEILDLLDSFGDPSAEAELTEIKGIILVKTALDLLQVIEELKKLTTEEPWMIKYIMRVIPIEKVMPAELEYIQGVVVDLAVRIRPEDSFRVTVEKRHSILHSMEIIECIADGVKRRVNLKDPDWVVLVEIVGKKAGISIVKKDQIFSAAIEKRGG